MIKTTTRKNDLTTNIRKITENDFPRIAEIIVFSKRFSYRSIFNNDFVSFNELNVVKLYEQYKQNKNLTENMLVLDDGIIKGIINQTFYKDSVEITDFYIEPFFMRKGIGTKLIQSVIENAKKLKLNKIFLWVIEENFTARKFYEINGFLCTQKTKLIENTYKNDICYELLI